ncbi:MAG: 23S rRNA (guanosine(2251)-2'-O)-methyltransferase RlmB, partial [Chloroflexaceae bacterium]|nr:23S rRNA (guanosine(2251)-2'-O)-methyltransferase RlmB [Chloroflexaceae bacterium]
MSEMIYGRNAVREALRANRRSMKRLIVANGAQQIGTLADAVALAGAQQVPVEMVDRRILEQKLHGLNH